jgi:photosystem II stability/assembly factor-like uncharacterized protein
VNALAFDPGNPSRLFAGTIGGLWVSPDKGRRWSRVPVGGATRVVSNVAFNTASNEIFVGLSDVPYSEHGDGIWLSATGDPGSFTRVSDATVDGLYVPKVIVEPRSGGDVYLATSNGLYRGTRSGATWTWSVLDSMTARLDDAAVDFTTNPPTVYAAVLNNDGTHTPGMWSHDAAGWHAKNTGLNTVSLVRLKIGLAKSAPQTLYLKAGFPAASPPSPTSYSINIYKTTNGGTGWSAVFTGPTDASPSVIDQSYPWYNSLIAVDPSNANHVYVGGIELYRTTNGGSTWSDISGGADPAFPLGIHGDQHAIAFDPANSNIVYPANDGGVYRSSDISSATWHWNQRGHGMLTAEHYRITSQRASAGLIAGGAQDNGTQITFGNRTWYQPGGCDGADVAVDATDASTLYGHCNGNYLEFVNPVPYTPGGSTQVSFSLPAGITLQTTGFGIPIIMATDPTVASVALVRGVQKTASGSQQVLLKTTDDKNYAASLTLPGGQNITAMAISVTSPKKYYVGVTSGASALIYVSADAGGTWTSATAGGVFRVNAIAVDPGNGMRAWGATSSGQIIQTIDGGGSWTTVSPVDSAHAFPSSAAATGIAADGVGNGRLFASADIGVFQGILDGAGNVSWSPLDDGLPDGIDVSDVYYNPITTTLTIGTKGNGTFRRDVSLASCPGVQLIVRDSVFDHGQAPTPSNLPNPEFPIPDPARPGFYKPDDTTGGRVYFWESTDIRTTVPNSSCPAGSTDPVDHVEFESCPSNVASCPPWLLTDVDPVRGQLANVFMQVSNQGFTPASNVRVIAMYADASAGVPLLPANFWTATAVPGGSSCGALDESTGWHMIGCNNIPKVEQAIPEVTAFPWNVPASTAEHTCVLSIVDSPDDPIVTTSTDVEQMTVNDRHVAHRNLHIIDGPSAVPCTGGPGAGGSQSPGIPFSGLTTVFVPNRWNTAGTHEVILSRTGMERTGRLAFLLPRGVAPFPGLPPQCGVAAGSSGAVAISLPGGVVADGLVLSAGSSISLGDRSTVLDAAGNGLPVASAGTGLVDVGADVRVGSITAAGSVSLRSRAAVLGNVVFGGTLSQQQGSTIQGTSSRSTTLTPADTLSWTVTFPASSNGPVQVEPQQTTVIPPGRFDTVSVHGTLRLSSGTYFMDSLDLESQSKLLLDQANGPVVIYARQGLTIRGDVSAVSTPSLPDPLIVDLGTQDVFVETSFSGTIVAPNAGLTLGSVPTITDIGAFFAKNLVIRPGTSIRQNVSRAWAVQPACRALSPSEAAKATQAGLAPTLYSVPALELTQQWPIPFGQRWLIGVRYDSGTGRTGTGSRFRVLSLFQGQVKGGNTFVLRQ